MAAELRQLVDDVGPEGSTDYDVYLRTAVSVDPQGWAQFGHVKMRDYRWARPTRATPSAQDPFPGQGEKAWTEVPGEYRANLRRIITRATPSRRRSSSSATSA